MNKTKYVIECLKTLAIFVAFISVFGGFGWLIKYANDSASQSHQQTEHWWRKPTPAPKILVGKVQRVYKPGMLYQYRTVVKQADGTTIELLGKLGNPGEEIKYNAE
jgi:hypothetical protein